MPHAQLRCSQEGSGAQEVLAAKKCWPATTLHGRVNRCGGRCADEARLDCALLRPTLLGPTLLGQPLVGPTLRGPTLLKANTNRANATPANTSSANTTWASTTHPPQRCAVGWDRRGGRCADAARMDGAALGCRQRSRSSRRSGVHAARWVMAQGYRARPEWCA